MSKDPHKDWTEIRIATPLPMDVAGTLMQLIGTAYPSAVIVSTPAGGMFDREYALVMKVDPAQRAKRVTKKQAEEAKPDDIEHETDFLGFDNGWISASPPEELGLYLGEIAHQMFTSTDGAINYVEWEVRAGEQDRYVLSVAKSKEQTPHALRTKAEARVAELEAQLAGSRA